MSGRIVRNGEGFASRYLPANFQIASRFGEVARSVLAASPFRIRPRFQVLLHETQHAV